MNSRLAIAVGFSAVLTIVGAVMGALFAELVGFGLLGTAVSAVLAGAVPAVALVAAAEWQESVRKRASAPHEVPLDDDTVPSVSPLVVQLERLATYRDGVTLDPRGIPRNVVGTLEQVADRIAEDDRRSHVQEARLRQLQADVDRFRGQVDSALSVRDAFLARMSHELRTPLNAILGYLELLEEDHTEPALLGDLSRIRASTLQLQASVDAVLDLTQLEADAFEVVPEPLDLPELVRGVRASVAAAAAANHNQLNTTIPEGLHVHLDRRMLQSILYNLTSNACKYTNRGSVAVEVEEETGRIRVVVSDTGIGMTERQIREAFRPFGQADPTSMRRYDGAGLGLAVVRGFAEAMGGNVEIRSALGRGSRVEVSLPRQCESRSLRGLEDDPTMLVR